MNPCQENNGKSEWIYGSLDMSLNNQFKAPVISVHNLALSYSSRFIKPETIGQFWKKDRFEKRMFVGDIVSVHQFLFDGNEIERESTATVIWLEDGFGLKFISGDFVREYTGDENHICMATDIYGLHEESFELIGNIFENPVKT